MNRRKKIQQLLKAHAKKASAKLAPANKSKYISKADRLKLEAETSIAAPETVVPVVDGV
jgi:transcription initiation factor TFIIIB Brf1 subunit/transcription initiation factor TFIIB